MAHVDRDVVSGTRYGYRLGILEGGRESFHGETWVTIPRDAELALRGVQPNPAGHGLPVAFSLPDASPARLEMLDLTGRRILSREVGSLGPGSHVLNLDEGRPVPAGVYLLRLTRGGRTLSAKAVVIR